MMRARTRRAFPWAGLAGALLTAMAVPACQPRVIHQCPPSRKVCEARSPRRAAPPPSARHRAKALFGFNHPRAFGLPYGIERPQTLAVDPRGELIAVGGRWGGLQIIRIRDGRSMRSLGQLEELAHPLKVGFTAEGRYLVSAGHEHRDVKVWSVDDGRLLRSWKPAGYPVTDLATGSGTLAILATSKGAEVWDVRTGRHVRTVTMPYNIKVIRVAASSNFLLAAGDLSGSVRVFSTRDPAVGGLLPSPGKRLSALALSADGRLVATGHDSGLVRVAKTQPLRRIRSADFYARATPVEIRIASHDKTLVVGEDDGGIAHVRLSTGRLIRRQLLPGRLPSLSALALSPTGNVLAAVSHQGRVTLWQSDNDQEALHLPRRFEPTRPKPSTPKLRLRLPAYLVLDTPGLRLTGLAVGRRGQFLAVAGHPSQVRVYYLNFTPRKGRTPVAKQLYRRTAVPMSRKERKAPVWVAITPDRKWLLTHGGGFTLRRWALVSGRKRATYARSQPGLRGLLPVHDNRTVITLDNGRVIGWTLKGRHRYTFAALPTAYFMGTSHDSRHLVLVRGWDKIVDYELPQGAERWRHDSGLVEDRVVLAMVLPPGSHQLLTYHRNGFLRTYDLARGTLLRRQRIPHPADAEQCTLRPDGRVLACAHPGGIDLTEIPSGALLGTVPPPATLRGGRFRARALQYSAKGNVLVVQTTQRQVVAYSFDLPGDIQRYTGVEAKARIRLGLPIVPPPVLIKPSQLPQRSPLENRGSLRR